MLSSGSYIFIDADDTLWKNEKDFREAEARFAALLVPHARIEDIQHILWEKQEENIPYFGYGSKTYFMGMTDAAIDLCGGSLDKSTYEAIRKIVIDLCYHKVEVFEGVEETLRLLSESFRLVLATKGENMEQLRKFERSGLSKYFVGAEVMMGKDEADYRSLALRYGLAPEDMVMTGNSVRSDVIPVLNIGGTAIYVPHEIVWVHEMADLPESERLFQAERFSDLPEILSKL